VPVPTIGILAGMGPRSTGPFLDLVVTACQKMYGARHVSGVVRFAETKLPVVDAADCLARAIVQRWMSARNQEIFREPD
jgi:aspartate/glutamate racemase